MTVNDLIKRLEKIENKNSELIFYTNFNDALLERCNFYDIIEDEDYGESGEFTEFTIKIEDESFYYGKENKKHLDN